ncbi:hypothetical protein MUG78_17920 [Gordonia alkaliphila]|uniref:hypothetical protein n=1 Tax=Gordonia alkaliphila TaxID=1053547 RepID=UPI001FF6A4E5|nr:hypothetical protein [Gordonia alkaliphila]MCK0441280.1 hypothetical protein [Gordonia alkaliphila]
MTHSAHTTIALDDRNITSPGGTAITEAGGWVELALSADLRAILDPPFTHRK